MTPVLDPAAAKAARLRKFWTQSDLASAAGIDTMTVSRLERGAGQPKLSTLRKLAVALEVEPQALLIPAVAR